MKIVMATNNENKVRELREILAGTHFEPITQKEAGLSLEVVEDADTFEGNAVKKAIETHRACGLPALADDSGLEVDALGGAPGVYSARYAGEGAGDKACMDKLLKNMEGEKNRRARFVSVVALAFSEDDVIIARGECEGSITHEPKGENGFGYDPVFYVEQFKKTFAQVSADEKNSISHRGRALGILAEKLSERK